MIFKFNSPIIHSINKVYSALHALSTVLTAIYIHKRLYSFRKYQKTGAHDQLLKPSIPWMVQVSRALKTSKGGNIFL